MSELLSQYPVSDHEFLIRQFNTAILFGYTKEAAKQFAAGMINSKGYDLSHLKAYEKAI